MKEKCQNISIAENSRLIELNKFDIVFIKNSLYKENGAIYNSYLKGSHWKSLYKLRNHPITIFDLINFYMKHTFMIELNRYAKDLYKNQDVYFEFLYKSVDLIYFHED